MNTPNDELDPARRVRDEDAFDVGAVAAWLGEHAPDAGLAGIPEVRQFPGGVSNLTYLLRFAGGADGGERDVILRRPPAGRHARGAHDMHREYEIQRLLKPVFPLVPEMLAYCGDESVIGAEFYVMARVAGRILRTDLPADLALAPADARRLGEGFVDLLVRLHEIDPDAAGLAAFGHGDDYVTRQVAGWSKRYRQARTPDVGDFEGVMAWLEDTRPADRGRAFLHNDYRLDNLVLDAHDPLRIVGVLDWELATVGDPLMELGSALAYWVEAGDDPAYRAFRRQPSDAGGMPTRAEIVARYAQRTGRTITPDQWRFYEVFGLFRLAVIAQQVYARFVAGQTTNPAFAALGDGVRMLDARTRALIAG